MSDESGAAQHAGTAARAGAEWPVLAAIGFGGAVGAESRYGVGLVFPHGPDQFPWSTVVINASGCLLIGVLMVLLLDLTSPHASSDPFWASGSWVATRRSRPSPSTPDKLIAAGHLGRAVAYVSTMVVVCAVAVWVATAGARQAGLVLGTLMSNREG